MPATYLALSEATTAVIWMGFVFIVAALGVIGLGVWVVRGDRRNRGDERRLYPSDEDDASAHGPAH